MGLVIDSFVDGLKKSFQLKLWLYFFLAIVVELIGIGLMVLFFAAIGLAFFFVLKFSIAGMIIYALLFIIAIVLMILFSALIDGIKLNFARDYLHGRVFSFGRAFELTKPRVFDMAKVQIIISLFLTLLFVVLMLPMIFSVFSAVSNFLSMVQTPEQLLFNLGSFFQTLGASILPVILWAIVGFLVFALIVFFLSPFLIMTLTVPLFEERNAMDSIRRMIELGKKNYFSNFGFYILFLLAVFVAVIILTIVEIVLSFLGIIPLFLIFVMLVIIVIEIIFKLWITVFESIIPVKVYEFDVGKKVSAFAQTKKRT